MSSEVSTPAIHVLCTSTCLGIERDHVGAVSGSKPADARPEKGRGVDRRKAQRLFERQARAGARNCAPRSPCRGTRRRACRPRVTQRPSSTEISLSVEREMSRGFRRPAASRRSPASDCRGRATRGGASRDRHARRRRSGRTSRPAFPARRRSGRGSRLSSGRIALNRCVKPVSPSASAALRLRIGRHRMAEADANVGGRRGAR